MIFSSGSPENDEKKKGAGTNAGGGQDEAPEEFQTLDAAFTLPAIEETKKRINNRGRRRGRRRRRRRRPRAQSEEQSSSHFEAFLSNGDSHLSSKGVSAAKVGRIRREQPSSVISGANLANFQYNPPQHRENRHDRRHRASGKAEAAETDDDGINSVGSGGSRGSVSNSNSTWDWPGGVGRSLNSFDVAAIKDDGFFGIKTIQY